ncbi:MAG: heme NO-binding domain-containing protein [Actinomycetota bacterium]
MKGIVFNLLEQVVTDQHGEDAWDQILEAAGQEGAYTAVGSYPDEQFMALVGAAVELLRVEPDDLVRWFGKRSIPLLASRYPAFFEGHTSTRSFVLTLNDVIHPEVRKLFPGADVPTFDFRTPDENTVELAYVSSRKLCSFAEGLVEGAAGSFGETVEINQTECMKRGDARCVLVCAFAPARKADGRASVGA